MHKRVATWLNETGLPESILRHQAFHALLAPGFTPGYTPPSPRLLKKMQYEEYKKVKTMSAQILSKRAIAGSITADGWTSASGGSYFGVLLHYVDASNFMQMPILLSVVCFSLLFTLYSACNIVRLKRRNKLQSI